MWAYRCSEEPADHPHTSDLAGSVVNTTKTGTSLLSDWSTNISHWSGYPKEILLSKKGEKKIRWQTHFLLQLSQKEKGELIYRTEKQNSCTKAGCWGTVESLIKWLFQQRCSKVWSVYIYTVALSAVANMACLLLVSEVRSTCREEHQSEGKLNK